MRRPAVFARPCGVDNGVLQLGPDRLYRETVAAPLGESLRPDRSMKRPRDHSLLPRCVLPVAAAAGYARAGGIGDL